MLCGPHDLLFDHVGNVGDHLNGRTEVFTAAFTLQNFRINFPGCDVAVLIQVDVNKPFIMAKVEVGLRAIVGNEHFTMLIRVHRPRIDIDIRVEFLNGDLQTAIL